MRNNNNNTSVIDAKQHHEKFKKQYNLVNIQYGVKTGAFDIKCLSVPEIDFYSKLITMGSTVNLTSINDDCKLEIFKYLEFEDLINVAETSKQLHTAAEDIFKRKYGGGRLAISGNYG